MASQNPSTLLIFIILFTLSGDLCSRFVVCEEIITSTTGQPFGRTSREPKYKVEFHPVDSGFYPEDGQESVAMTTKDGKKFTCFLPVVEESKAEKSVSQQNSSSIIIESERRIKQKTPDELMDVMKDKCFYRQEGWWTYEFCYEKHVKQVHLEDNKIIQEFVLGVFDVESTAAFNQNHSDVSMLKDPRSKDASQRYHAHQYKNGTMCDLTDQTRETEVRFVCAEPNILISSIKEIATCKYVVIIHCPLLCKHPMFQQERPSWLSIHCNEMPIENGSPIENDGSKGTQISEVPHEFGKFAT